MEQNGKCGHSVCHVFFYENPYLRPQGARDALLHVLDLYTRRAALVFPSWNSADRRVFRLHRPDPKGTDWKMRKISNPSATGNMTISA